MTYKIKIDVPGEWFEQINREIGKTKEECKIKGRIPRVQYMKNNFRLIKIPKELKNAIKKR